MRSFLRAAVLLTALTTACADDDSTTMDGQIEAGACGVAIDLQCDNPFDPPTFDAIYTNVLSVSCGGPNAGCHGTHDSASGLQLWGKEAAYSQLVGADGGTSRVMPGNPGCSELVRRLESTDRRVRMPLNGDALSEGERCAVVRWIADGAEGP